MNGKQEYYAFNRGVVSRYALARLDLKRLAMSAEVQTNWMPRAMGPMSLRAGLVFIGEVAAECRMLPFIFSITDMAWLEVSVGQLRVWVNDALVSRPAVTAAVTNGAFTTDLAGWTDADELGATSAWVAGGFMGLTGDGKNAAIRSQALTISNVGVAHALRIVVERGPVVLRIGSTSGGSEYLRDATLGPGVHSIAFVPAGATAHVQIRNRNARLALVDSVAVEGSGVLSVPLPYTAADLSMIRYRQSGDVVFVSCAGKQQRKIERRANGSWSVVLYQPEDGPLRIEDVGPTTITPSGLIGNISLAASGPLFNSGHVGALWRLTSSGQKAVQSASADDTFTGDVRVFGVGESRRISVTITGTWVGTVTLQRSIADPGAWEDVRDYTANVSTTYADGLDNQIIYYRLGFKTGDYTSGTADLTLNYSGGSASGVVRITSVGSETAADAEVLSGLGGTSATSNWAEGLWSDYRGWPSAVELDGGRLWWAGKDKFLGSIVDSFESFDPEFEGDAGPISRSVGAGPVDNINWLLSLSRLLAGTDTAELACRSSSFDEPLTPTNFNPKRVGTQGTAKVSAQALDARGVFLQRGRQRLYELAYSIETQDYSENDLCAICPEFLAPGVRGFGIQRQPDTRIHCIRDNGTVAVLVFDRAENLQCWVGVETDGVVEDVMVLPGAPEDAVYYVVRRTVGGVQRRYLERWALESDCRGGLANKQADSLVYQAGASNVITNLGHLEGRTVVVWAQGKDLGEFTVSGSQVSLPGTFTHRMAGLPYTARFKSAKLAYIVAPGQSALGARKKVGQIGLVMADTHADGVRYGPDFDTLDPLPMVEQGAEVDPDAVHADYEHVLFSFPGDWTTDARVCLEAQAPRPATVMALVIDMVSHSK